MDGRTGEEHTMTFNIPSQHGGIINNIGRDQHVTGGQHGTYAPTGLDVATTLAELRAALEGAGLTDDVRRSAADQVDELERATSAEEPDRQRAATALEKLTRILVAAGPLATAATAFAAPLGALVGWLGPLGQGVARLLVAL
jgi:hypothetical protein